MTEETEAILCSEHGTQSIAFVCGHLVDGEGLGFYHSGTENDDKDNCSDAWCGVCDEILMRDGEWTEENEKFANIQVVCAVCYRAIRERNSLSS